MAFFKKKDKHEDIDPSLLTEDDFYIGAKKAGENVRKAHSLTADEIQGTDDITYIAPEENPLEALRKKMLSRQEAHEEAPAEEEFKSFFNIDSSFLDDSKNNDDIEMSQEPVFEIFAEEKEDSLPSADQDNDKIDPEEQQEEEDSLLKNCLPFIMDGNNGEYVPDSGPSYTLDSVASILGMEEEEEKDSPINTEKTMVFSKIEDTGDLPDISDIDNKTKSPSSSDITYTSTMPVIIPDEMISATRDVDISEEIFQNKPNVVDLSMSETAVEEEYQSYQPEFEYNGKGDYKGTKIKLLKKRRSCFLKLLASVLSLVILGFFALPLFGDMMLSFSPTLAAFTCIAYLLAVIVNFDIFTSFTSLFSKRSKAEAGIALSVLISTVAIVLSLVNTLPGEIYYGIALMTVVSLVFRAYLCFRRCQYIYTNFLRISDDVPKYGIALIDDGPTTFAMARKAIDGDVLVAAPRRIGTVTDFIKNSTFDVDLEGRAKLLFYIGLGFSLLVGIAVGFYRNNFMSGAVTACIFTALFSPLTSLACSILPLSSAASHLNRYGAALTSLRTAKQIEAANACVIDCDTLFPKGSIKLSNMKVMAQNNLEDTIACACAITESIKSPLAPIFRTVMETNKTVKVPVADSIKYEERLGITGWVGNKRIFIGNRALMLAHEISVPDAEKDKKLMRDGYFPVYVACDGKACALLVLKYIPNPDIARELDRISAMGLTILVNNCDQNISEEMVCDYFDLYSDSVKIMSSSGVHMYKTAVSFEEKMNAGAVIRRSAAAMAATVYCANRVKRANAVLQIAHILSVVLGVIIFSYIVFGNAALYINGVYIALYQFACFLLSGIAYLFTKP